MVITLRGVASGWFALNVFSGAVAQSVLLKLLSRPELHNLRPKAFTLWPLIVDGRVVWDRAVVRPGSAVEVRVAFFERELGERLLSQIPESLHIFGAEVKVSELVIREVALAPRSEAVFRVEFLSPARFETPPYVRRPVPVFDLTPRPLNIFKSAVKTAMRLGLVDVGWARRFLRWAYASVGVVDFGCGGRCTVAVRLAGGRRVRGFVGWAVYRAFETSMLGDMWRVLSIAEAFGVGSNRPLGFGAVRIAPVYGGASGAGRRG